MLYFNKHELNSILTKSQANLQACHYQNGLDFGCSGKPVKKAQRNCVPSKLYQPQGVLVIYFKQQVCRHMPKHCPNTSCYTLEGLLV